MTNTPEDDFESHGPQHHEGHDEGERGRGGRRQHHGPRGEFGRGPRGGREGRGFGPGFGPGGFRGQRPVRARKGDVRAAILSLLGQEPHNGYQLMKAIAEETEGAWRPSPGSVYPTLQQLQDEGLISTIGEGRRTEFELTDEGRAYISKHAEELEKAWEGVSGTSDADLSMHASAAKLMGVIHQFRFAATDAQREAAVKAIDDARRALYLILAE